MEIGKPLIFRKDIGRRRGWNLGAGFGENEKT